MILHDAERRAAFESEVRQQAGWGVAATSPAVEQLLATVSDVAFPGAVVPRRTDAGPLYYAVAETGQDWRNLAPLLRAFVGITVTDFRGTTTPLRADDPFEAWLAQWDLAAASRFSALGDARRERFAAAGLERLCACLQRADIPQRLQPRSTRQVLEEFRLALVAEDPLAAEEAIGFLRENMRLDALNIRFLQVQLDGAFGEWERLRQRSFFDELCYTRRPPRVTAGMVEALYWTAIAPIETAEGAAAALAHFRAHVLPRSGELLAVWPQTPQPAVVTMFLLKALASDPVDHAAAERLQAAAATWPAAAGASFERYLALVPPPTAGAAAAVPGWATLGQELAAATDSSTPVSVERARAVLLAAAFLQSLEGYEQATAYVRRLPAAEREELLASPSCAGAWTELQRFTAGERVPRSWVEWVELLPQMSYEQARNWADQAAEQWPIAEQLQGPADVRALANALGSASDVEDRIYEALPALVEWVQSDPYWPNPSYLQLYQQLGVQFILSNRRTPTAVQALASLLDGILQVGLTAPAYKQLLQDLGELTTELRGVSHVNWLIDLAELLITHACPDPLAREALWGQIIATVSGLGSRLSEAQLLILRDLSRLLGTPGAWDDLRAVEAATPAVATVVPAGYCVALYTLTESVAQRVARGLEQLHPGIRVELLHSKVADARLEELARRADLFAVCWRSAKHAATDVIKQKRPAGRPLLYATGKGSSGILAEIERHLAQTEPGAAL